MLNTRSGRWVCLSIALFTLTAFGCASSGTPRPVTAKDLPSLAGRWTGWITAPGGTSAPGTWDLAPNGEYVAQAGAFIARGTAQVQDGAVKLIATSGTGGLGINERTSTATLSERADGTLVLRGNGRSDRGPFDFEMTRAK